MMMAKASQKDINCLIEFFQFLGHRHAGDTDADAFMQYLDQHWSNGVAAAWSRVVFGFQTLLDNCCDPDSDVLDWKPEIKRLIDGEAVKLNNARELAKVAYGGTKMLPAHPNDDRNRNFAAGVIAALSWVIGDDVELIEPFIRFLLGAEKMRATGKKVF